MNLKEKIEKAKVRLMLDHPYFGTVASSLGVKENSEILTFSSNGEKIEYNGEYLERLSVNEIEFVLANGAMHSVLKHEDRAFGRTKWLWQTATDYIVNNMLVQNGMQPPEYANYEPKFQGMYAEEVYEILRSEMMQNTHDALSQLQESEQITQSDDPTSQTLHMHEEKEFSHDATQSQLQTDHQSDTEQVLTSNELEALKAHFEHIFEKHKRQGNLPKDLKFVVPTYFSHQINWREFLYGYIASHAKSSYSFSPPNMKYLYQGVYLPSLSSDLLRIVVAIDTSGSINEALLTTFLGEVSSLMQQYPNYEIDLITADAKIQSHQVFLPGEPLNYEISGGGGTDFRPVFEYIEKEISYPTVLLYFTDGEGRFPETEPFYDVLWVVPTKTQIPFGESVVLDVDQ
jgi:predicted metal-dependent peptidase